MKRLLAAILGVLVGLLGSEAGYRLTRGAASGPTTNPRYVVRCRSRAPGA